MRKAILFVALTVVALLPAAVASALSPPIFILKWGSTGTANGQFQFAQGAARTPAGDVWIADYQGNRVERFSSTGTWLQTITSDRAATPTALLQPTAVAVDATGNLFVADGSNGRICKYDPSGAGLAQFGTFTVVTGVAASPLTGDVYATDYLSHSVQHFDNAGNLLGTWGSFGAGPGQFEYPYGVAVDPTTGNVVVADMVNNRIEVFSPSGAFLFAFGSAGAGPGQFAYPAAPHVDAGGNIYVSDQSNNRVQKFTGTGAFMVAWGSMGTANGQFNFPNGITTDASGVYVYVADRNNSRVQKFGDPVTAPLPVSWGRMKSLYR